MKELVYLEETLANLLLVVDILTTRINIVKSQQPKIVERNEVKDFSNGHRAPKEIFFN